MTIFLLLCSCAANNLISDEYTHSASVLFEDSDRLREESTVTSKELVSEETEGLASFENYKELIKAIESAMYDRSLIEENPNQYCEYSGTERSYICSYEFLKHLYDGSDDIAYQNLGYLIKDIDGDGVDELLLGENDSNPEKNYDGLIYDLYTYADGKIGVGDSDNTVGCYLIGYYLDENAGSMQKEEAANFLKSMSVHGDPNIEDFTIKDMRDAGK